MVVNCVVLARGALDNGRQYSIENWTVGLILGGVLRCGGKTYAKSRLTSELS